jgi:hypothetical protein
MSLLCGAGDGTFPTHQTIGSDTQPWQAVAADVDGNTKVTVRVGDGKGGLAQPLSLPATMADLSLFVFGDLNQDGKLDFIFVRPEGWGVFLNTWP